MPSEECQYTTEHVRTLNNKTAHYCTCTVPQQTSLHKNIGGSVALLKPSISLGGIVSGKEAILPIIAMGYIIDIHVSKFSGINYCYKKTMNGARPTLALIYFVLN